MTTLDPESARAAETRATPAATALLVAGVVAFVALLYVVRDLLHPFVAAAIAAFLWYPLRAHAAVRRVLLLIVLLAIGYGLYDIWPVLVPFAIAFLFAFLFDPVATSLAPRVPRWLTALLILALFAALLSVLGAFVLPPLFTQIDYLLRNISSALGTATAWYAGGGLAELLRTLNIPEDQVQWFISTQISPRLQTLLQTSLQGVLAFLSGTSVLLGQLLNMVLIPFLGYYLLKDFPALRAGVHGWLARLQVSEAGQDLVREIDEILSTYLRGQLVVASIIGALAATLFSLAGVPYAIVLGLILGVLDVIPYVGLIASIVLSLLVVFFSHRATLPMLLLVAAITLGLHALESYVIGPRIIGRKLGLPPVILILALFVFAHLLGFFGLLIAVPAAAVLAHVLRTWYRRGARSSIAA